MLAAEALVFLLENNTGVATMVGSRVFPQLVPQGQPAPAIAYQRISHIPEHSHSGFSSLTRTRFQLTLVGNTHAEALNLALAVRRALSGVRNTVGDLTVVTMVENETDGYGDTAQVPVVRMDLMMTHNES